VPEFSGAHGHPYLVGREMMAAFLRVPATSIARDIEHEYQANIQYVRVDDPLIALNINTSEDYAGLLAAAVPDPCPSRARARLDLLRAIARFPRSTLSSCRWTPQRPRHFFRLLTNFRTRWCALGPRVAAFDCVRNAYGRAMPRQRFFDWELRQRDIVFCRARPSHARAVRRVQAWRSR